MDPETKRLAFTVVVGLLVLFPVFNQVAYAMLDALTTEDHQARFTDFFKSWDDVPVERKLEYWDGRNVPPGQWDGEMGEGGSIREGGGGGAGGGAGGGGSEGGENPGEGEGSGSEARPPPYKEIVLWEFRGDTQQVSNRQAIGQGHDYHWVNVTWDYEGFTGSADFRLLLDGSTEWAEDANTLGPMGLYASGNGTHSVDDPGRAHLEIDYSYNPTLGPQRFAVVVTGAYLDVS